MAYAYRFIPESSSRSSSKSSSGRGGTRDGGVVGVSGSMDHRSDSCSRGARVKVVVLATVAIIDGNGGKNGIASVVNVDVDVVVGGPGYQYSVVIVCVVCVQVFIFCICF